MITATIYIIVFTVVYIVKMRLERMFYVIVTLENVYLIVNIYPDLRFQYLAAPAPGKILETASIYLHGIEDSFVRALLDSCYAH